MPRILTKDEVEEVNTRASLGVDLFAKEDRNSLLDTLFARDRLIAALADDLRRANPRAFLVAVAAKVAAGTYGEDDARHVEEYAEKVGKAR